MDELAYVNVYEDKSVQKVLSRTAKKLKTTYEKKRKINERLLRQSRSKTSKVFTIIFDVVCACLVVFCGLLCFANLNSRSQGVVPSFAGYSSMQIVSPSMTASGFDIGDNIVVRSVDPTTLKVGDNIAFYVYFGDYTNFDINTCTRYSYDGETTYSLSVAEFMGAKSAAISEAARAGSKLVFHQIVAAYQDQTSGTIWFQTQGSSNDKPDGFMVSQNMVVGIYDASQSARFVSNILSSISSREGLATLIIIPIVLMGLIILIEFLKDLEISKLQRDIIEEKRKLTDDICVRYKVGFSFPPKDKFKVLAQAADDEKNLYVSLLWKDGTAPHSIRKYLARKHILISTYQKKLEIRRECDKMFKDGVDEKSIAKFYHKQKNLVDKDYQQKRKLIKKLKVSYASNGKKS